MLTYMRRCGQSMIDCSSWALKIGDGGFLFYFFIFLFCYSLVLLLFCPPHFLILISLFPDFHFFLSLRNSPILCAHPKDNMHSAAPTLIGDQVNCFAADAERGRPINAFPLAPPFPWRIAERFTACDSQGMSIYYFAL